MKRKILLYNCLPPFVTHIYKTTLITTQYYADLFEGPHIHIFIYVYQVIHYPMQNKNMKHYLYNYISIS